MKNELFFKTNAKMERLVGRELITNSFIAIFELVKNSYDANATEVEISFENFLADEGGEISTSESIIKIIDNGDGMSLEEIQNYWMELGTPHKENLKRKMKRENQNIDIISRRMLNGEKGIGRFGVDKIGSKLTLISIDKSGYEQTKVEFDWNSFDDTTLQISEVPCFYEHERLNKKEKAGTTLIISQLRDSWKGKDIKNLKEHLKKFLSPVPFEKNSFDISITSKNVNDNLKIFGEENKEKIKNNSFDFLKNYIEVTLDKNGYLEGKIKFRDRNEIPISEQIYNEASPFGRIKVKIFYLDRGEKSVFNKKMGLNTREYGNIKIYRGNFRVMPYGEAHNDWLEIDNRHAQGIFRTLGTRDIIGYILLDEENSNLREATNRMGLVEDDNEFIELKETIWQLIKKLEGESFNRVKDETKEANEIMKTEQNELKVNLDEFINNIKITLEKTNVEKKALDSFLKDSISLTNKVKKMEKASKEVEKKIKVYEKLLTREEFIVKVLHEVQNKVAYFQSQSFLFETYSEELKNIININVFSQTVDTVERLVKGALKSVSFNAGKKKRGFIHGVIKGRISYYSDILDQEQIKVEFKNDLSKDAKVLMDIPSLENAIENLFSNSIKALSESSNKKIFINTYEEDKKVKVKFADNGNGIPEDKIPLIFSLWSSFQEKRGSGIGLSLIKNTMDNHKGEVHYIASEEGYNTTFLLVFNKL